MNCDYCDFQTAKSEDVDKDGAFQELHEHMMAEHRAYMINPNILVSLLRLHIEFDRPIIEIIDKYFEVAETMGKKELERERGRRLKWG